MKSAEMSAEAKKWIRECVIPLARDARQWRAAEHNAMVDDLLAALAAGKISAKALGEVVKQMGNISQCYGKFKKAGIIAKTSRVRGGDALDAMIAADEADDDDGVVEGKDIAAA